MSGKAKLTGKQILALPMKKNDAKAKTIRQYLCRLSEALATGDDDFSGKRALGNSGWREFELYPALVSGGAIDGTVEADGFADCEKQDADKAICLAIRALEETVP